MFHISDLTSVAYLKWTHFLSYWINLLYMIFHNIFSLSLLTIYSLLAFVFYSVVCVCVPFFIKSPTCFLLFSFSDFPVVVIWTSFFTEDEALLVSVSVTSVCIVICLDYFVFFFVLFACVCVLILQLFPFYSIIVRNKIKKINLSARALNCFTVCVMHLTN